MRYFLLEPKPPLAANSSRLLVAADTPDEALLFVPEEARETYRVSAQSGKGVDRPAGLVSVLHAIQTPSG